MVHSYAHSCYCICLSPPQRPTLAIYTQPWSVIALCAMRNCGKGTQSTCSAPAPMSMARKFSKPRSHTTNLWANIARKYPVNIVNCSEKPMSIIPTSIAHRIESSILRPCSIFGYEQEGISSYNLLLLRWFLIFPQNVLYQKNHIYKTKYSGWYCVSDEMFLTDCQLKEKEGDPGTKVSIESGHPVQWTEEVNYMFKLSEFQDDVIHWIKQRWVT